MTKELTLEQEREVLIVALNAINNIIYAKGAPLGTSEYFEIRNICVNSIKICGGEIG